MINPAGFSSGRNGTQTRKPRPPSGKFRGPLTVMRPVAATDLSAAVCAESYTRAAPEVASAGGLRLAQRT